MSQMVLPGCAEKPVGERTQQAAVPLPVLFASQVSDWRALYMLWVCSVFPEFLFLEPCKAAVWSESEGTEGVYSELM